MGHLDARFLELLTIERVKQEFADLKNAKTDLLSGEIWIARGCDGISYKDFEKNIDGYASLICDKGRKGTYLFSPFREKETPKPPFNKNQLGEARKANKIRVLSISTIQDTLFQRLISDAIYPHAEEIFAMNIDLHSYGYRSKKSSKMAIKKIRRLIDEGYHYVLDGDISKFFDEIDHTLLRNKMVSFFGEDNRLVQKFLYRFIHVDKIPVGKEREYKYPERAEKREKGIPQGGVLSGLLANVFLYDFDLYVVNKLMPKFEFKYFRYADDFVLLFKHDERINMVHSLLEQRLRDVEKLKLHPIGEKTKQLDLSTNGKDVLDFLGFGISPKYLRIKEDNYNKFKKRIVATLKSTEIEADNTYFSRVVPALNRRIVALEDSIEQNDGLCPVCNLLIKKRSWIGYFMMVDDVRQLRKIDTMIRTEIYKDYHKHFKKHIRKGSLLKTTKNWLKSVEKMYYKYKKQIRKYEKSGYCNCIRYYDKNSGLIKVVAHENTDVRVGSEIV